jgi:hypothetical protein
MAAQLNVKRATITAWRKRNNLPHNIPNSNVPMTQVLTPAQCQVMRTFLRTLVCLANTKPPGTELRIGKFMEAWRENVYNIRTKRQRPTPDNTP